MPSSELPFEPLNTPRVASKQDARPTPVNWFQHIAPRLPEAPAPSDSSLTTGTEDARGARKATFGDVAEVAAGERRRRLQGEPEPPDIALLREQARQEAQERIEQALAQAQVIAQEARDQGYQAGYEAGYAVGQQEAIRLVTQRAEDQLTAYREDLTAFVAHIEKERQQAWAEIEPQVIGLVFDLAKKVIKQEIEVSREVALSVIKNALRRVTDSSALRIRVHAEDLETVRSHRAGLLSLLDGIPHIEIIEDRRVDPGGCVVETSAGNIDARIETQLEEVAKTLEQMVAHQDMKG